MRDTHDILSGKVVGEGWPMFYSISDVCSLDASSNLKCENEKCIQALPSGLRHETSGGEPQVSVSLI